MHVHLICCRWRGRRRRERRRAAEPSLRLLCGRRLLGGRRGWPWAAAGTGFVRGALSVPVVTALLLQVLRSKVF